MARKPMTGRTRLNADYLSDAELRALDWGSLGSNVRIHSTCIINGSDRIHIGDNVRIDPYCVLSVAGGLSIGSYVHVAAQCSIVGAAEVTLGDFNEISHGVRIFSSSSNYNGLSLANPTLPLDIREVEAKSIILRSNIVVGANSVVLPGVTLADGVSVGALSLVNRSLESWTVYGGVPARRIRDRVRAPEGPQHKLLALLKSQSRAI